MSEKLGFCRSYFRRDAFKGIDKVAEYFGMTEEELKSDTLIPKYTHQWFRLQADLRGDTLSTLSLRWGLSSNYISRELYKEDLSEALKARIDKYVKEVKEIW